MLSPIKGFTKEYVIFKISACEAVDNSLSLCGPELRYINFFLKRDEKENNSASYRIHFLLCFFMRDNCRKAARCTGLPILLFRYNTHCSLVRLEKGLSNSQVAWDSGGTMLVINRLTSQVTRDFFSHNTRTEAYSKH